MTTPEAVPRLAINQHTTELLPFEEDLRLYKAAGVLSVGVVREKLEAYGIDAGIDLLERLGFRVCELHILDLLHSTSRTEQLRYARATIDLSRRLGCENICVMAGPWLGGNRAEELKLAVESLRAVLPYAEDAGVTLGLEPLGPFFCTVDVLTTLGRAVAIVGEIASPRVAVAIDVHHVWWDLDVPQWVRQARGRISAVQLNDVHIDRSRLYDAEGNRLDMQRYAIPGEGMVPLAQFLQTIESDGGYRGDYQVEIWDRAIWNMPGAEVVERIVRGYRNIMQAVRGGTA